MRVPGSEVLAVPFVLVSWRPARPLVASTVIILLDVPFLLAIALDQPLWTLAVAGALSAAGIVCADTLWESQLQTRVPAEAISRVSSYDWLGSLSMNPVGNVVIGVAITHVGAEDLVLAVLGVTVLTHGLLLLSPAIRTRPPWSAADTPTHLPGQTGPASAPGPVDTETDTS